MACGGCGSVRGMTKPEVANYIQELIDKHKLQSGIKSCGGDFLPAEAKVVLCDKLADMICELIKSEQVCFPTIENFAYDADKEELSLTFGGKDFTTYIHVKGSSITGSGDKGVYTISQDGNEVVKIDTGVQDVKIEDGKLKVSKSGGVEKEFDLPMPTVTPVELTNTDKGVGSIKYGDVTLPVVTKPAVAEQINENDMRVTNSDGTKVEVIGHKCADVVLTNAFENVPLAYAYEHGCQDEPMSVRPSDEL